MSIERIINQEGLRNLPKFENTRKRFMVSEGELFNLYKEIQQVRKKEEKEAFMSRFKTLLKEAVPVKLVANLDKQEE